MSSKLSVRVKSTILAQTLFWDCQNCWHFVEKNWLSVCNRLNPIWCLHRLKQTTDMTYKTIFAPGSVNHFFFFYPNKLVIDDISINDSREMSWKDPLQQGRKTFGCKMFNLQLPVARTPHVSVCLGRVKSSLCVWTESDLGHECMCKYFYSLVWFNLL